MREATSPEENPAAPVTPTVPWGVVYVEAHPKYRLRVRCLDSTEGEVEMGTLIKGEKAGVFAALNDPETFGQAYPEHGAVTWPDEIDLAPDAMYDTVRAKGRWVIK